MIHSNAYSCFNFMYDSIESMQHIICNKKITPHSLLCFNLISAINSCYKNQKYTQSIFRNLGQAVKNVFHFSLFTAAMFTATAIFFAKQKVWVLKVFGVSFTEDKGFNTANKHVKPQRKLCCLQCGKPFELVILHCHPGKIHVYFGKRMASFERQSVSECALRGSCWSGSLLIKSLKTQIKGIVLLS